MRQTFRCHRGASAAEFALVLPLLLLLLFGIIDASRFLWEYNRAEKATQMGVRFAVVTDPVASGLTDYSFAVDDPVPIPAGNAVPANSSYFLRAVCDNAACTCVGGAICPIGHDPVAFNNIVNRMTLMYPAIGPENVQVSYENVGLGFSGDPNGADVAPLVTVKIREDAPLTFQPITTLLLGADFAMPNFRAALTYEDGDGDKSN